MSNQQQGDKKPKKKASVLTIEEKKEYVENKIKHECEVAAQRHKLVVKETKRV